MPFFFVACLDTLLAAQLLNLNLKDEIESAVADQDINAAMTDCVKRLDARAKFAEPVNDFFVVCVYALWHFSIVSSASKEYKGARPGGSLRIRWL